MLSRRGLARKGVHGNTVTQHEGLQQQMTSPRWIVFEDGQALASRAAELVLAAAHASLEARGRFDLVLAGGSTPGRLYRLLAEAQGDQQRWRLWLGDERCLPADDPQRNDVMVRDHWISRVPRPPQLHPIPAELGPQQAALRYADALRDVDRFDLVLLGLGEDGHTASLFPQRFNAADTRAVVPVTDAPKPPSERVSLSLGRLSESDQVLFLVAGAGKRAAVAAWRGGAALPAARVSARHQVTVLCDRAALPMAEDSQ
jgi:6-phosphogluconolactonase